MLLFPARQIMLLSPTRQNGLLLANVRFIPLPCGLIGMQRLMPFGEAVTNSASVTSDTQMYFQDVHRRGPICCLTVGLLRLKPVSETSRVKLVSAAMPEACVTCQSRNCLLCLSRFSPSPSHQRKLDYIHEPANKSDHVNQKT